mgnify:FL=1|jgi:hypothetical protein
MLYSPKEIRNVFIGNKHKRVFLLESEKRNK